MKKILMLTLLLTTASLSAFSIKNKTPDTIYISKGKKSKKDGSISYGYKIQLSPNTSDEALGAPDAIRIYLDKDDFRALLQREGLKNENHVFKKSGDTYTLE